MAYQYEIKYKRKSIYELFAHENFPNTRPCFGSHNPSANV